MQRYPTDQHILATALAWLTEDHEVALVTVVKTWGSSPRPIGSLMIMRRDGRIAGSVSGGCIEEDLLERYRTRQLSDRVPTYINYGVNHEDALRFGLPCGGRLELLIERLDDRTQLQQLIDSVQNHLLIARQVDLQSGQVTLQTTNCDDKFVYTDSMVRKVFGPQWTLLLIGAGHLSQAVAQIALLLDYQIIVCDPREVYTQSWQLEGVQLVSDMPDVAVQEYAQQSHSIVVALTHDPKLDELALLDALQSPAFYVGAIGSQRNCEARRVRLQQMGLNNKQLQRLHAPVGIPIGSYTPTEIALSILAEITQERNARQSEQKSASDVL